MILNGSFWTGSSAPWWSGPLVIIITTMINVWGARFLSHREHKKTAEKVNEVHEAVVNGKGKAPG